MRHHSNNVTIFLYQFVDHDSALKVQQGSAGVTYERWGRTTCGSYAETVYRGYMANGWYNHEGTGSTYLCLPENPSYVTDQRSSQQSWIYTTEYETNNEMFSSPTHDYDAPCAVCYAPRSAIMMIPAETACPNSWNFEYSGFLMTNHRDHNHNYNFVCVDGHPERIAGSGTNQNGALLYFVTVDCDYSFMPCLPFKDNVPLSCVVCTR